MLPTARENARKALSLFAFTSSSYALGADGDDRMRARLEKRAQGIPVMLTCQTATAALHLLSVKRLSLIHPPWFSEASDYQGAAYFRAQGFEVVQSTRITPQRQFTEVAPTEVFSFVSAQHPGESRGGLHRRKWVARWVLSGHWRRAYGSPCSQPTRSCCGTPCTPSGRGSLAVQKPKLMDEADNWKSTDSPNICPL